ncbi:heat shock protein DnaJ, putative [Perkinsus marinus ATCC 50983]|uniref:Heat shock protein DnaJ, putative n=1 Tax=Perkinsus marinus (strain ATCC 50983 / TXsc) TaxID=423536 RepID=C5KK27_PERM5|nr:heat shock protein DnaJ, putative [Perkinsus marinus ATCC 50983]EER15166.1 heat shock protein DnaJ, putative [Perkinsus marinus ATCC 50983]|eukprot:XP_002783370.1 heat shock protein DnaJ, putative [Perkinsus marinus ATCC 50983]
MGAVDCDENRALCEQNNIKGCPKSATSDASQLVIYPRNPIPQFIYEGKLEAHDVKKAVLRYLPTELIKKLDAANVDTFLTTDAAMPKVLLFTEKDSPPPMFKALSNEFRKEMQFGLVNVKKQPDLAKRFGVKKAPKILLQQAVGKKPEAYKGEVSYIPIADWVNLHRETFSRGGGFEETARAGSGSETEAPSRPWLAQEIPEITKRSAKHVCFDGGEGHCVIYLKEGGPLSKEEEDGLVELRDRFTSQLHNRGAKLRWVWLDVSKEPAWAEMFGISKFPNVVVFNPHKRLRFCKFDDDDEEHTGDKDGVEYLVDKVLGGDGRFKIVKGQKLPELSDREEDGEKAQSDRDEL